MRPRSTGCTRRHKSRQEPALLSPPSYSPISSISASPRQGQPPRPGSGPGFAPKEDQALARFQQAAAEALDKCDHPRAGTSTSASPREESPSHARRTTASPRLRGSPGARTRRRPPRYGFAPNAIVPQERAGRVLSPCDPPAAKLCFGDQAQARPQVVLAATASACERQRCCSAKNAGTRLGPTVASGVDEYV